MEMNSREHIVDQIRDRIIEKLEYLDEVSDSELQEMIGKELQFISQEHYISIKDRVSVGKQIFDSMRKLDILQMFLEDDDVTEIMINGPNSIFIEKNGHLFKSNHKFKNEESLNNVIQQIVAKCNRVVNESKPIVDARLMDGSRVNCVINPIALNGPILTIRRFPDKPYLMADLIKIGSISSDASEFLKKLVISGYNIIISGGTGSGKTTFLNALSAYIPKDERIITIEDSAELQIQGIDNLVRMETKTANVDGGADITIRDLIKTSLRMRPNRIIVGEVRGGEAMDMVGSAMNCGHDGSMSTVHSNSAADTIMRLETMMLMSVELPINAIRRQIGSGVDIIVHLGRMRDKSRKVQEIVELINGGEDILVNTIYRFEEEITDDKNRVKGELVKIGNLVNENKLKNAGFY